MFNICGLGETLIPHETIEIAHELLKEGHYVTIVTNGVLTNRFQEIARFDKNLLDRLLIKFSLHWLELKRKDELNTFTANVNRMRDAGASISIELTANDETEPYIQEIIEYTTMQFGERCHITIPRDESSDELKLQSKHNIDEFYDIWKVFESDLLDFKYSIWGNKRKEYCYAGEWSGLLNIQTGEWRLCYNSRFSENIFDDISKPIPFIPVGKNCRCTHCYNGHSWLTLGDIPSIDTYRYSKMRDRECRDGSYWLSDTYRSFISQRLDKNNIYPHSIFQEANFNYKKIKCYGKKIRKKLLHKYQ